jgi:hypothetical protein
VNAPPLCEPLPGLRLRAAEESYDGRGVLGAAELGIELDTGVELDAAAALTGVLAADAVATTVEAGRARLGCPTGRFCVRPIVGRARSAGGGCTAAEPCDGALATDKTVR